MSELRTLGNFAYRGNFVCHFVLALLLFGCTVRVNAADAASAADAANAADAASAPRE